MSQRGKAKRPGRPTLGREKFTTTLPPGYSDYLKEIGQGNASAAIVRLVDEHKARKKMNNLQKLKDPYARAQMLEALEKTLRR